MLGVYWLRKSVAFLGLIKKKSPTGFTRCYDPTWINYFNVDSLCCFALQWKIDDKPVKVDKWDGSAVKNSLDDSAKKVLFSPSPLPPPLFSWDTWIICLRPDCLLYGQF